MLRCSQSSWRLGNIPLMSRCPICGKLRIFYMLLVIILAAACFPKHLILAADPCLCLWPQRCIALLFPTQADSLFRAFSAWILLCFFALSLLRRI